MALAPHPYAQLLERVEKPVRYMGGEVFSIVKDPADPGLCCQFVLCFPDVYDIGMSHLGTKILYAAVNKESDLVMERCFCPWVDMERELREAGLPLISLETRRRLADFDVVGFSLQYEMTYTNVLTMLDLGGIPLRAKDRTDEHPLVIAGGPSATHPEAIAPFIDAFVIGDGEEALPRLLKRVGTLQRQGVTRREILLELARGGGVYVPEFYDMEICGRGGLLVVGVPREQGVPARVSRNLVADLNKYPFPESSPVAATEAIFDRMSVEIARGCTEGCRFCQAGMIYRPVRERDPAGLVETVTNAVRNGGYDEASLTSLSTADYSAISPLIRGVMERLRPQKISLGISSLRAYGLSEELLDEIASVKATGLTFAPEAGTQRMRDVINKNISEEDIHATCHRIFSRGWSKMKLYFILGLPTETWEDVEGIAELGKQAMRIGRKYQRQVSVTVSVSSHVPKPHTPFQWCAMEDLAVLELKQIHLRRRSRDHGFKFRRHDLRVSHLEAIVGRGDRRVADLIEDAWNRGARFDSWEDRLEWEIWQRALDHWEVKHGIERDIFLCTLPVDARLPWDHIDVGLKEGFLLGEYRRSLKERLSPPCGKPLGAQVHHTNLAEAQADERKLVCYHCGVACDMSRMRLERQEFLAALGAERPVERIGPNERDQALERIAAGRAPNEWQQGRPLRLRLRFQRLGAGRLLSQLDLVRLLPQILRRADLKLYFSQGYSPHPVVSFAPAITQGAGSMADYMEASLTEAPDMEGLLERLRAASPLDLVPVAASLPEVGEPPLAKVLDAFDWLIQLQDFAVDDGVAAGAEMLDTLECRMRARLAEHPRLVVERKGRRTELDLADRLVDWKLTWTRDEACYGDLEPGHPVLRVRLRQGAGAGLKPAELAAGLLGRDCLPISLLRVSGLRWQNETWTDPLPIPVATLEPVAC